MPRTTLLIVTLLLSSLLSPVVQAKSCHPKDKTGTHCSLPIEQLRLTQFAVGSLAVDCKAAKLEKKSAKQLRKYLAKERNRVPVVIGPQGEFYMTDHHHLASALYRANSDNWSRKKKRLQVEIIVNYYKTETDWGQFWNEMQQHRSYNHDNKGIANMNFALLPKDVSGLLNDPYRTLSRWVRESCGYLKAGKDQCDQIHPDLVRQTPYFMEFYWAEFFRQALPLNIADIAVCQTIPYAELCLSDEVDQLKLIYPEAMRLAASDKAKRYFEALRLDPLEYGYNPTGEHLPLTFSGINDACEKPGKQIINQ